MDYRNGLLMSLITSGNYLFLIHVQRRDNPVCLVLARTDHTIRGYIPIFIGHEAQQSQEIRHKCSVHLFVCLWVLVYSLGCHFDECSLLLLIISLTDINQHKDGPQHWLKYIHWLQALGFHDPSFLEILETVRNNLKHTYISIKGNYFLYCVSFKVVLDMQRVIAGVQISMI